MSGSVKITLRILLLLCFYTVFSQTGDTLISKIQTGKISGIVIDSKNSTPLINSECKLYRNKDTIVHRISKTDSIGYFSIDSIAFGKYWIEIEYPGYKIYVNNKILLDEIQPLLSLDTIKLKKTNIETEEILVEENKPMFTFEGDKKIFNVDESIISKGGTALDLLRKVPMVNVDMNDNVTLRGSAPKILIDGKENRYTNLRQLPAEGVEKIELITNPPAKYSSEGITGIINIVMMKSDKLGFNGYSYLYASTQDNYGGGVNADFKKDKTTIFTSISPNKNLFRSTTTRSTQYYIPDISYYTNDGSYNGNSIYNRLSAGIEYDVMKNSVIGFEGNFNYAKSDNSYISLSQYLDENKNLTSYFTNRNNSNEKGDNYYLSGYTDLKFNEKGHELSGDMTFTKNKSNYNSDLTRQYFDSLSNPLIHNPLTENDKSTNISSNLNAQLDYVLPFGKSDYIETGYKYNYRVLDNDMQSDTLDYLTGNYINNINLSNHFKHTEIINALYFIFGIKIKGFSYKLGLRAENTNSKGELITENLVHSRNYTDFLPSASFSQTVGENNQVQLSYSKRITRPKAYRLNPFVYSNTPGYITYGNPMLNTEYADSYELGYMFFTKLLTMTPSAFFRRMHNIMSSYSFVNDTGTIVSTYKNASGSSAYGIDFIITSRSFDWLSLNSTFSFYNTKFDEDIVTDYSAEEGFSWQANIRAFFSIGKIFNIELYYRYNGKKVNAQSINLPSSNLDIGIGVNLFKGKGNIRLYVMDIFKSMLWETNTSGIGYNASLKNQYNSRGLSCSISYRFGNSEEYYQKKKKVKQNENENIDKGDEDTKNK